MHPHRVRSAALAAAVAAALHVAPASAQRAGRRTRHTPEAPRVSDVTLSVAPRAASYRWSFVLENHGSEPVEVVADRRLLSLEVVPAGTAPLDRRREARRGARCAARGRPGDNQSSPRVTLSPGTRYSEGFDLRDLCGLALPGDLREGAALRFAYGFPGRAGVLHAVVLDEHPRAIVALEPAAEVTAPALAPTADPRAGTGDGRLSLVVTNRPSADRPMGLRAAVRLTRDSVHPVQVFYRPNMIRFEIQTPDGRPFSCGLAVHAYAPVRDFFVPMRRGRSVRAALTLGALCPREALLQAGTYRATAVFESRVDRSEFSFPAFSGEVRSAPFDFQLHRSGLRERYRPLTVEDPFEPPHEAP